MPISFTCPHCGAQTEVSEESAGQSGSCAQCGKAIAVPAAVPAQYAPPRKRSSPSPVLVVVLVAVLGVVVVCGGMLAALLSSGVPRIGNRRVACMKNMKDINLALLYYEEANGHFPPAYTTDENGNPLHSWRVLILPYLEWNILYEMIDLDQPWDSPHNRALADIMPYEYRCPSSQTPLGNPETSYAMIVGPGTISDGPNATKVSEISDGESRTLMIVEVSGAGIHWMEPRDLDAQTITFKVNDGSGQGIQSNHPGGANVGFCDGSVHFFREDLDPNAIKAMSTIAGGEDTDIIDNIDIY